VPAAVRRTFCLSLHHSRLLENLTLDHLVERRETDCRVDDHGACLARANFAFDVSEPPVSVVPTAYPSEPGGAVLVQNNMTINVNTIEFRGLNSKLDEIITLLRTSNKISGEPRDQLSLRSRLAKFSSVRRNQTLR